MYLMPCLPQSLINKTNSCSGELKDGDRIRMKPMYSRGNG